VSYLALELTGLSATLVGVDGLTFGIWDAAVKVNKVKDGDSNVANDPDKLDWANFTVDDGLALDGFTVDAGVDVDVQGSVALDAFGVLIAKGSYKVQFGTVTELGADHLPGGTGTNADTKYEEMVVTLGSRMCWLSPPGTSACCLTARATATATPRRRPASWTGRASR
jgi:hypothetical protein